MPVEFVGGRVSLAAGASDSITLKYERDCKIHKISFVNTGRARIDAIEIVGVRVLTTGIMEVDNFKQQGNILPVIEPIDWPKGIDLVFRLTDLSGATNDISVMLEVVYA